MTQPLCDAYLKQRLHYDPATGVWTWLQYEPSGLKWNQTWADKRAGTSDSLGYRFIGIDGIRYPEHRLAFLYMLGGWPEHVVDHVDGNPSNNVWTNLRACTQADNLKNRKTSKSNKSGVSGVRQNPQSKRWSCSIYIGGKFVRIGTYDTFDEAKAAREQAEREHYGEYRPQR